MHKSIVLEKEEKREEIFYFYVADSFSFGFMIFYIIPVIIGIYRTANIDIALIGIFILLFSLHRAASWHIYNLQFYNSRWEQMFERVSFVSITGSSSRWYPCLPILKHTSLSWDDCTKHFNILQFSNPYFTDCVHLLTNPLFTLIKFCELINQEQGENILEMNFYRKLICSGLFVRLFN